MSVGFIGLGSLGKTIAKRLIAQGVPLVVWNRTKEKALDLGVEIAQSPAELSKKVNTIFVMVFDSQASEEVIFGKEGLVQGDIKGKTIVDMTTNHYRYVEFAYQELKTGCVLPGCPSTWERDPCPKGRANHTGCRRKGEV